VRVGTRLDVRSGGSARACFGGDACFGAGSRFRAGDEPGCCSVRPGACCGDAGTGVGRANTGVRDTRAGQSRARSGGQRIDTREYRPRDAVGAVRRQHARRELNGLATVVARRGTPSRLRRSPTENIGAHDRLSCANARW
ncbi:hypothetical protein NUV26_23185, partial [Burkholderia pseudomultivorans]|uniref:hypothetical protein n=1 Tax=Burkholderia pseudomultivorans TaxID=1207504 RepID=UPI002876968A